MEKLGSLQLMSCGSPHGGDDTMPGKGILSGHYREENREMRIRLAGVILLCAGFAQAQPPDSCVEVENDVSRLACFDRLSQDRSQSDPTPVGWQVRSETDRLTDAVRTTFTTFATGPQGCKAGGTPPRLEVICGERSKTWFVRIKQSCSMGHNEEYKVLTRLDRLEPFTETFAPAPGRNDLQLSVGPAARLVGEFVNSKTYLVRIEPTGDYPDDIEFPVTGLAAALSDSGTACKL